MSKILVVDDKAIFRDPIAACLRLAGYDALCAADGQEALALLRQKSVSLVLLDIAMPVMDGLELLRQMRRDPALRTTPVIMLSAAAEKQKVLEAAQLGVQDYMLKSRFSVNDLLARVKKYLSPAPASGAAPVSAPPGHVPAKPQAPGATTTAPVVKPTAPAGQIPKLLTREMCIKRAEQAMEGKTLSGVVREVVSLAASPRADLSILASTIAKDGVLSARVLHSANSASYASMRGIITTIPDAVRQVGCNTIRNIAASVGIFDAMPATTDDGFNPIRCWQHSFAAAKLCESLAAMKDPQLAGVAYLAGLCHDLGEILLHCCFWVEYKQILDLHEATGIAIETLEREMLGMSRGDLVVTILRCIGLPDSIRGPIEHFHQRKASGRLDESQPLARLLRLADAQAKGLLLASSTDGEIGAFTRAECRGVTGDENPPSPDPDTLRSEVLAMTGLFGGASGGKLLSPLFPQLPVKLWVARDPKLSSFDPVAAALQSMAEATVHDRLPTAAEMAETNGLVVIARVVGTNGFAEPDIAAAVKAAGRNVPVLWLVLQLDPQCKSQSFDPVAMPLSLARLHEFVASVQKQAQARETSIAA